MKKYSLLLVTFLTPTLYAGNVANFVGNYQCQGKEVGTLAKFTCSLEIKKTGETYASSATCDDGTFYQGNGLLDEKTNILSTGFINPKNSKETGVSVAKINAKGELTNVWTYLQTTTTGLTTCHKLS